MPTLTFNDFLKRYGSDTTNNIDLLEWGKELKIPNLKYVSKDELNTRGDQKKLFFEFAVFSHEILCDLIIQDF